MPRHTLLLIFTATVTTVMARGRYEFIEEADLPAFYSMRSAQMAQKAQLAPQVAMPQDPYSPYLPYQMYHQQMEIPAQAAQGYGPFAVYSPVYRGPTAAASPVQFQPRPTPVQYHPMYFHQAQPQAGLMGKKTAKS